jgi:signal transduction histidine kinase
LPLARQPAGTGRHRSRLVLSRAAFVDAGERGASGGPRMRAMPIPALKSRYNAFAERVLCSLTEIERRDVRSFDRWFYQGGGWRWLLLIVAVTTILAGLAAMLPWNMSFTEAALLFNGVTLLLLWAGLSAWFGYRKFQGKIFRFIVIGPLLALLGAFVGAGIAGLLKGGDPFAWLYDSDKLRHVATAGLVFGFLYALVVALIAHLRNREYRALTANLEAEARQSDLSRQLAESRLKLLQLQIEPHFLFNTLGSAQQLAEKGAPAAARLIGDLIRFLRAATPSMRDQASTLGQEARLAEAYLSIMRTRLGARLQYAIDLPPGVAEAGMPPGMLITLVENAIKHGIEPAPDGGCVVVSATRDRDALTVTVADTGAGLARGGEPGQGIGLTNIRERLALLYGPHAALELAENTPRGFIAQIRLPVPAAASTDPHWRAA